LLLLKLMKLLLALACVGFGCASPDLGLAAEEQAMWNGDGEDPDGEVIEVEGEAPFDPNWEGPDQGAPGSQGEPSGGGGGGGNGGTGDANEAGGGPNPKPRPIPERKDCSEYLADYDQCVGCCDYNLTFVDGPTCNRKPRHQRGECWRRLMSIDYPACLLMCHRARDPGILTIGAGP